MDPDGFVRRSDLAEFFECMEPALRQRIASQGYRNTADIDDLVQQTILAVISTVNLLDAVGFVALKDNDHPATHTDLRRWMLKIARNLCAATTRKRRETPANQKRLGITGTPTLRESLHDNLSGVPAPQIEPDPLVRQEDIERIRRALSTCCSDAQTIFRLQFDEELSVPEIAETLRISIAAAKGRLFKARQEFIRAWLRTDTG
jgi:RNA polymerase sigma factor (sigma-70 family)